MRVVLFSKSNDQRLILSLSKDEARIASSGLGSA